MARPLNPTISFEAERRFWDKVDISPGQGPHGDCWCWTGRLAKSGYPCQQSIPDGEGQRYSYQSSHIALQLVGKPRPSVDLHALHSCDHKPCVNPAHLRWGTTLENLADHLERRSQRFSSDEIRDIRTSKERQYLIARRYGVTQPCIANIQTRISYKHVPD